MSPVDRSGKTPLARVQDHHHHQPTAAVRCHLYDGHFRADSASYYYYDVLLCKVGFMACHHHHSCYYKMRVGVSWMYDSNFGSHMLCSLEGDW